MLHVVDSSDSKNFSGKDIFKKIDKGLWAIRKQASINDNSLSKVALEGSKLDTFIPAESLEEITNILTTINQYRDYIVPDSPLWKEYVKELFHILGFSTTEQFPRTFTLSLLGTGIPKAVAVYVFPSENFKEAASMLPWESYLQLVAAYYQVEWGVLTNGLELKIVNYEGHEQKTNKSWPEFDNIIRNQRTDTFCTIYKTFSFMKGDIVENRTHNADVKDIDKDNNSTNVRHNQRYDFWNAFVNHCKSFGRHTTDP